MSSRDPGACPDTGTLPPQALEYGLALAAMFDEHGQRMTQKRLGELTNTSEAAVSRYLAGKRIAPEVFLKRFLEALESRGVHVPERVRRDLHQKRQDAQEAAKRSFAAQNAHLSERVDKLIKEMEEVKRVRRRELAWLILKSRRDNAQNGKARARIIHQLRDVNAENEHLRGQLASATVYVKAVEADLEHSFDRISQLTIQVEMLAKEVRGLRARTAPVPGAGTRPTLKRHRWAVRMLFTRVSLLLITSQLTALGVVVLLVGPVASDGIEPTWLGWTTLACGCVSVALFIHTRIQAGRKDWTASAGRVLATTLVPMLAAGLVAWAYSLPKYSFDTQQLPATVSKCTVYPPSDTGIWGGNNGYTECSFTWTFNGKSYTQQDQYDKSARTAVTIDPRHPESMHPHKSILFEVFFGVLALIAAILAILWLCLFVITLGGLVDEWRNRYRHPEETQREPDLVLM